MSEEASKLLGTARRARAVFRRGVDSGCEAVVGALAGWPRSAPPPVDPQKIFVLRNNGIGDLLLSTPLFEALAMRFPAAQVAVGVGAWNLDTLRHDPFVSEVIEVNAPWFNWTRAARSPIARLRYLWSAELRFLRQQRFDLGIDVLGSRWGALLLLRAGIPFRVGVRGYAGGHRACQIAVPFDPAEHVAHAGLRIGAALGAEYVAGARPRISLDPEERSAGEARWRSLTQVRRPGALRVVLGPGGGVSSRCWPVLFFRELAEALTKREDVELAVVGGPLERDLSTIFGGAASGWSYLEKLPLRETFALVAAADLVIANSSMLMHVAAAFCKPVVVLLGESIGSREGHDAQWGYAEGYWSLGKERGGAATIASPGKALTAVEERLASLPRRG